MGYPCSCLRYWTVYRTEISKFPQVGFHWTVYGDSPSSSKSQNLGEARFTFSNSFDSVFGRPVAEVRATVREMVSHLPPAAKEHYLPDRVLDVAQKLCNEAVRLEADGTPTRDMCFAVICDEFLIHGEPPSGSSGADVNYVDVEEEMMEIMMQQSMGEAVGAGRRPASMEYLQGLGRASVTAMGAAATCTICMEEFSDDGKEVVKLECSHSFHYECMRGWMERNHVCPLCRYAMPREKVDMHVGDINDSVFSDSEQHLYMAFEEYVISLCDCMVL